MRCVALLALLVLCTGLAQALVLPEWEDESLGMRKGWHRVGLAQPEDQMEITVALPLRRTEHLTALLMEVSDPTSPRYGT